MKKALSLIFCALLFWVPMGGCSLFTGFDSGLAEEEDLSPSPTDPVVVPSQSQNVLFGVAWVKTDIFNPYTDETKLNHELSGLVYEGLFSVGTDFEPQPCLCQSYAMTGRTFVFTLRRDVLFHDGSSFTAQDARYSLQLAAAEGSVFAKRLEMVADIEVIDDYTLQVTLSQDNARFPALLDIPIVRNGSGGESVLPGTGPYRMVVGEEDRYLQAYSGWWQKITLSMQRILLYEVTDAAELIYGFESDAVGVVGVDPTASVPLGLRGDCEVWNYPTSTLHYLGFNATRKPLDNALVRRALSYAVDRDDIVTDVFSGYAQEAGIPAPATSQLYSAAIAERAVFDLSKLSTTLFDAGISDSDGSGILDYDAGSHRQDLILDFIVNSENSYKVNAANRIAGVLNSVGLSVKVRELKWADFTAALSSGDFDLYYGEVTLEADFSLDFLLTPGGQPGSLNYGGFHSEEMNSLLAAYRASGSVASACAAYVQIQNEAPIVPILFKTRSAYTRRGEIMGITPSQNNLYYGFADWKIEK